jgi:hypothetical protein
VAKRSEIPVPFVGAPAAERCAVRALLPWRQCVDDGQQQSDGAMVMIRRELPVDVEEIRAVTAAAFRGVEYGAPPVEPGGDPGEATLVSWLRDDAGWIPSAPKCWPWGSGQPRWIEETPPLEAAQRLEVL